MSSDTRAAGPPPSTVDRCIELGETLGTGAMGVYRALTHGAGQAHLVRTDLLPDAEDRWRTARRRPLLAMVHLTDLQLADVQSPARFEFFNREFADPRFSLLVPTQRPNEAFTPHAVEATVATLNRITAAPVSGAPLELAVTTGDAIDNGQWNELRAALALFEGGPVALSGHGARYEGVQRTDWPDQVFWRPDGDGLLPDGTRGPDLFRAGFGYPLLPGVLDRAMAAFTAGGLRMPWLACYGNHEGLVQGVGRITPELAAALVGGAKPLELPDDLDRDTAYDTFVTGAQAFLDGPQRPITADAARRPVSRSEFVRAHFGAPARPLGHGFGERNRRDGTAYYAYDLPLTTAGPHAAYDAVRFIALDTTCLLGGAEGALDAEQLIWLESVLREVHSSCLTPDGEPVRTGNGDRLVVLLSHHGLDSLTNPQASSGPAGGIWAEGPEGSVVPAVPAAEVEALLHRYPNVVLWINGHTHINGVRARVSPHSGTGTGRRGFWEITTCSIADWPSQTRIVELIELDGALAVACTMVDHDSPLGPGRSPLAEPIPAAALTDRDLAALHRELAANVPLPGYGQTLSGAARDRNVILPLPAPAPPA